MNITNKTGLPDPIVRALTHDGYSRGASARSVTQLIDSPRIRILRKEHPTTADAADLAWRVLGTAVHEYFERHTDPDGEYTPEERLFADVAGWRISGAIDIQQGSGNTVSLMDYKCTSVWSVIYGKSDWVSQLNAYAWLVEKAKPGSTVATLSICAILRDWNRRKAHEPDYPAAPIVTVDVPLWSFEERDAYIRERVAAHQDAEFNRLTGDELPPCTDEERWRKPTKFAVKKKGNKRALRVYDTLREATEHMESKPEDKLVIDERPGEYTRCAEDYCGVAAFCDQWQIEKHGTGLEQS